MISKLIDRLVRVGRNHVRCYSIAIHARAHVEPSLCTLLHALRICHVTEHTLLGPSHDPRQRLHVVASAFAHCSTPIGYSGALFGKWDTPHGGDRSTAATKEVAFFGRCACARHRRRPWRHPRRRVDSARQFPPKHCLGNSPVRGRRLELSPAHARTSGWLDAAHCCCTSSSRQAPFFVYTFGMLCIATDRSH